MLHESTQTETARQEVGLLACRLPPGARLPSFQAMKKQLGVNQHALDVAYDELSRDGVLERRPRSGVYLVSPFREACFLYIARSDEMLSETQGAPIRQNLRELNRQVERCFPGSFIEVLLLPSGLEEPDASTLTHIHALRRHQRILGIFAAAPITVDATRAAFAEWGLPCVDRNNSANPTTIMIRHSDAWWVDAVRHLREEGRQQIIMVRWMGGRKDHESPVGGDGTLKDIERIRLTPGESGAPEDEGERYVRGVLRANSLPQAFIVEDDYVCRGMLQGALKEGVRLEDRCALVTLFNEGAPISSTRELTRLEIRWGEIVEIQMSLMQRAVRGDAPPTEPVTVRPVLVIGKTSRRIDYLNL